MINNIFSNRGSKLFIILSGIFIANAIIAEMMGVKIFSLEDTLNIKRANIPLFFGSKFSFHLTAGVLLWPVVFIMTDIINEYYGKKGVKLLSYLTAGLISFGFIMLTLAIQLAPSEYMNLGGDYIDSKKGNSAFAAVFGQGLWIIVGSLVAFLVGQILDALVFKKIKSITGEKYIWLRATGSTLISQLIDSFVVIFIAFYLGPLLSGQSDKQWTIQQVINTGTGNYIYKFIVALALTPLLYLVHMAIEKYLGKAEAQEMKQAAMQD
jgi:queuosine precursor transporter